MKILVTGLPGSGKTVFSNKLFELLDENDMPVIYYNGDHLRSKYNDWDFTEVGRSRQLIRMSNLADCCDELNIIAICDFICPKKSYREYFNPDITVWMDTVKQSIYEDTNKMFENPDKYDIRVTNFQINYYDKMLDLINVKRRSCN